MSGLATVLSLALATHAVNVDQFPLREGCDAEEPVVAKLSIIGDPVEVLFAMVGSAGACYKVVVQSGGKTLQDYVSADGITGTDQFEQARQAAAQASVTPRREVAAPKARRTAQSTRPGGVPAPPLSARTFSGSPISLAGLRGKTVLVHFWASWRPSCREQMPLLAQIHKETAGQGVVIVGVNQDANQKTAEAYAAKNSYRWPMVFDDGGKLGQTFGVRGIPAVYVIDQNDRMVAQANGHGISSERRIRAGLRNTGVALP